MKYGNYNRLGKFQQSPLEMFGLKMYFFYNFNETQTSEIGFIHFFCLFEN